MTARSTTLSSYPQSSAVSSSLPLLLLSAFALQFIGQGALVFVEGTSVAKVLWLNLHLSDVLAFNIDRLLWDALGILLLWGFFYEKAFAFFFVSAWFFLLTALEYYLGGSFEAPYSFAAHAVRYTVPLALGLTLSGKHERAVQVLLRLSIALVFAGHGLEALHQNPVFIDMLIRVTRVYAGLSLSESQACQMLYLIGTQDLLLACLVLKKNPNAKFLKYMAFWGLTTALARVLFSPSYGLPLTLVRSCHWGVPLALLLNSRSSKWA